MNNKKILIIEDDKFFAELASKELIKAGAKVVHASNGEEGMKLVESEKPDLVLLDVLLPGMDGFEVLRKIKLGETTKKTPVLILSNFGSDDQIKTGQELGVTRYLIKATVTPKEIAEEVGSILGK